MGKLLHKLVCINNVSVSWVEWYQKVHYKRLYLHISNTPHCVLYHHRCFCVYSVAVDKTHVTASNPGVIRLETRSNKYEFVITLKGQGIPVQFRFFCFLFCRLLLRLLRAIWSEFLLLFVVVFLLLLYIPTILLAVVIHNSNRLAFPRVGSLNRVSQAFFLTVMNRTIDVSGCFSK